MTVLDVMDRNTRVLFSANRVGLWQELSPIIPDGRVALKTFVLNVVEREPVSQQRVVTVDDLVSKMENTSMQPHMLKLSEGHQKENFMLGL